MSSPVPDRVRHLVEPILADLGLDLYDLEMKGRTLRVLVHRVGGVDLAVIEDVSRRLSDELDAVDPIPGRYTLEVSSPGLERPLRTPAHFAGAVGEAVILHAIDPTDPDRRLRHEGELTAADERGVEVATAGGPVALAYDEIERARTRFEWGPAPKPGSPEARRAHTSRSDEKRSAHR